VTSGLTGRCYHSLSYDGTVRALGLEPSLIQGKSPMPYQSGVARQVGREGIEPPVSERRLVYSQLRPMARPTQSRGQVVPTPTNDAYAVVKERLSGPDARLARSEGVEPPADGFGDRGATMARAQEK
jgi:hypothetical protein